MVTRITRQSIALGFVCALGLLVLTSLPTQAQQGSGAITGTVKDQNGDPVGGLVLLLEPEEGGSTLPQKIKVNKKGKFAHRFLPNSRYKVKLQAMTCSSNRCSTSSETAATSSSIASRPRATLRRVYPRSPCSPARTRRWN